MDRVLCEGNCSSSTFWHVGQVLISVLHINPALSLQGGLKPQHNLAVCAGLCSQTELPQLYLEKAMLSSRPAGFQISCANVKRGTGHRRAKHNASQCLKESRRSICITILTNNEGCNRVPFWKQESPFRWYSYSWVNYNYGRFNLALNRKQVFDLRYVNATSRAIATALGTNLFSDTQTNFRLIRTTHWVSLSYLLNNRDEQVLQSTHRLWNI